MSTRIGGRVVVGRMLVLAAVGVVGVVAGCGESERAERVVDRPPATVSSAAVAAPRAGTIAAEPAAAVPRAPAKPLATVTGSQNDSHLDLLEVRRAGGTVQARFRIRPPEWQKFDPHVLSADGSTADVSGARLVDVVNLREHLPLQDGAGRCVCTHFSPDSDSIGDDAELSVQFAAPPPDVDEVSISMPTFASFDGIRLG